MRMCNEQIPDPNFKLGQEVANKTFEIVKDEIKEKNQLRNYSAMQVPNKSKQ